MPGEMQNVPWPAPTCEGHAQADAVEQRRLAVLPQLLDLRPMVQHPHRQHASASAARSNGRLFCPISLARTPWLGNERQATLRLPFHSGAGPPYSRPSIAHPDVVGAPGRLHRLAVLTFKEAPQRQLRAEGRAGKARACCLLCCSNAPAVLQLAVHLKVIRMPQLYCWTSTPTQPCAPQPRGHTWL